MREKGKWEEGQRQRRQHSWTVEPGISQGRQILWAPSPPHVSGGVGRGGEGDT